MHDPQTDVYAYIMAFVGQSRPISVTTGQILAEYAEFADVGLEDEVRTIPAHSQHDLAIQLTPDGQLPY